MANRKPIKKKHERFHINNFVEWLNNAYRCNYRVIAEPDPPEAIIQSKHNKTWIEISTAFLNEDYARNLLSYASPGEKPISVDGEVFVGPDKIAANNFVSVLKRKLEKRSYLQIAKNMAQDT